MFSDVFCLCVRLSKQDILFYEGLFHYPKINGQGQNRVNVKLQKDSILLFITDSVAGKVMFLHLSVILSIVEEGYLRRRCVYAETPAGTPSTRWPLQRSVRILLQCIVVLRRSSVFSAIVFLFDLSLLCSR